MLLIACFNNVPPFFVGGAMFVDFARGEHVVGFVLPRERAFACGGDAFAYGRRRVALGVAG